MIKSGANLKIAFDNSAIESGNLKHVNEVVKNAVDLFNDYLTASFDFKANFVGDDDTEGNLYWRGKRGIVKMSLPIDKVDATAYIGQEIAGEEERLSALRQAETQWKPLIQFCAESRPITEDHFHIPYCSLHSHISAVQAKTEEAFVLGLFVKTGSAKLILNIRNERVSKPYEQYSLEDKHKIGAVILCRSLFFAHSFKLADLRPHPVGGGYKLNEDELEDHIDTLNGVDQKTKLQKMRVEVKQLRSEKEELSTEREYFTNKLALYQSHSEQHLNEKQQWESDKKQWESEEQQWESEKEALMANVEQYQERFAMI